MTFIQQKRHYFFFAIMGVILLLILGNCSKSKNKIIEFDLNKTILVQDNGKEDVYMFKFISGLSVDSQGNIYLIDGRSSRDKIIRKYDKTGHYRSNIGRRGEGPGEYLQLSSMFIDDNDTAYLSGINEGLSLYGQNGEFIKKLNVKNSFFNDFYVDNNEHVYGLIQVRKDKSFSRILCRLDNQGEVEKVFHKREISTDELMKAKTIFSPDTLFCPVLNKYICYADNVKYELILADLNGNALKVVKRKEKPIPIDDVKKSFEKEGGKELVDAINFAPTTPFFSKIISDEKGNIYVIRIKPLAIKEKIQFIDIFNKDLKFMGSAQVPFTPSLIRNNAFYSIEQDEEGKQSVVRWEILNKEVLN